MTAIAASAKPVKYAPPSPRKTRPPGKFATRNPSMTPAKTKQQSAMSESPAPRATPENAIAAMIAVPAARPLKPSTMLSACDTAAMARAVRAMATAGTASAWSR